MFSLIPHLTRGNFNHTQFIKAVKAKSHRYQDLRWKIPNRIKNHSGLSQNSIDRRQQAIREPLSTIGRILPLNLLNLDTSVRTQENIFNYSSE